MSIVLLSAVVMITILAVVAPIGNAAGVAISNWLEAHFPDVEE